MASTDPAASNGRPDPPSVRLVLGALQMGRRLTGAQLREASGLPRRTVYQALRVLRERGVVLYRKSLQDTRQSYFWLAEAVATNVVPEGLRFGEAGPAQPAVSAP
jgi:DNA-binding transcriptional ArsR family regulator